MQTDPIADMLTRIRNAVANRDASVEVPASKFKKAIATLLVEQGYLKSVQETEKDSRPVLRSGRKYGHRRAPVIHYILRVSTPGRRAYAKAAHVPVVRGGLGMSVISTSEGLLPDRVARRNNVGGE